jgi:hypothetical protein
MAMPFLTVAGQGTFLSQELLQLIGGGWLLNAGFLGLLDCLVATGRN